MPGEHSDKEKRQAEHIARAYRAQGVSKEEAERRAWATVNARKNEGKK